MLRTVHHTYFGNGQTSNITVKDEWTGQGDPPAEYLRYHDLTLYYASTGSLWLAVNDSWELDQGEPVDYEVSAIREFRYNGAGQRHFTRAWSWNEEDPGDTTHWTPDESAIWTDYVGGAGILPASGLPFGDFEAHLENGEPVTAEQMRYLAGAGLHAQQTLDGQNDPIRYLHGDLIDSTMMLTDEAGAPAETTAYTAFGELVTLNSELSTRYGYAGGWGYESGLLSLAGANEDLPPITLQHVGARWYDPALGRFMQRDPMGIDGGLNVYLYCDANPAGAVDPLGLGLWKDVRDLLNALYWRFVNAVRSISVPKTTTPAIGPGPNLGQFQTCVTGPLQATPDIVRFSVGKFRRDRLIERGGSGQDLDRWDRERDKWVKPRGNLDD